MVHCHQEKSFVGNVGDGNFGGETTHGYEPLTLWLNKKNLLAITHGF